MENPFNPTFSLGYDPDGKNLLVSFPNGVQESRCYTTRDWLAAVQITQANQTTADTFSYFYTNASSLYDPTGHLQREIDAGNRTHAFFYHHLNQLVQEQHPDFGTISYGYDLNGNRTSKNTNGVIDYYGVDAANKLLWVNQGTNAMPTSGQANPYTLFGYDANGNMTSRERKYGAPYSGITKHYTFFWDGDDRLRLAQECGTTRLQANYDGDGVRVYKADTWTSAHNYTWGPGGVLFDSNNSSTYTPGFAQNQGARTGTGSAGTGARRGRTVDAAGRATIVTVSPDPLRHVTNSPPRADNTERRAVGWRGRRPSRGAGKEGEARE